MYVYNIYVDIHVYIFEFKPRLVAKILHTAF